MTPTLEKPEQHTFAAETSRVLQLMIHALYTNRDIFLRELISNASDACDKLRYAALTNPSQLADDPALSIHISYNEKEKTLTVTDRGIGMNRADLIAHLGTIAKSGTGEFLSQLTGDRSKDVNLIGQFGVGFYSAFMVADRVVVLSRKAGEDEAWEWESDGSGSYTVRQIHPEPVTPSHDGAHLPSKQMDPVIQRGDTLGRGTSITLHLKADALEYLDRHKLGFIVGTYSDHIGFPITLTDGEGVTHNLNEGSAIWARPKSEITDEQYQEFYRHVAHSPEKPWAVFHNKAEGKVEYTSLLFIPGIKPLDLFHPECRRRVKLYVKRVFITDEGVELIPPYLRFLRGVVDSADLPLNISREVLQKSPVLEKIRDSITSRVLGELKKRGEANPTEYQKFWENFGSALKEGLCESIAPRDKILEACRFYSTFDANANSAVTPATRSEAERGEANAGAQLGEPQRQMDSVIQRGDNSELVSLAEYASRMKPGQEAIYFLTGDSLANLRHSPQIEGFVKRGIEVLLLTDHVDDFWTSVTLKYGDIPFRSVMKAGADLEKFALAGQADSKDAQAESPDVAILCTVMKTLYGDAVREVRTTRKLSDTPVCLGSGEGDMDLRMERFLAENKQLPARRAKIVEINPDHPVITRLAGSVAQSGLDKTTEDALWLLFDQALIAEGEPVTDAAAFARRLGLFLGRGLGA